MNKVVFAASCAVAVFAFSAPGWAHHGDCVLNTASGKYQSIPEPAGGGDVNPNGGRARAAANDGTPFEPVDPSGPCGGVHPWPTVHEIPNGNANPNALGAPHAGGKNN